MLSEHYATRQSSINSRTRKSMVKRRPAHSPTQQRTNAGQVQNENRPPLPPPLPLSPLFPNTLSARSRLARISRACAWTSSSFRFACAAVLGSRSELRSIVSFKRSTLVASASSASRAPTTCERSSERDMSPALLLAPAAFTPVPSPEPATAPAPAPPGVEREEAEEYLEDEEAPSNTGLCRRARWVPLVAKLEEGRDPPPAGALPLTDAWMVTLRKSNMAFCGSPSTGEAEEENPGFGFCLRLPELPRGPGPSSTLRWSRARRSGRTRIGTGRAMPFRVCKNKKDGGE